MSTSSLIALVVLSLTTGQTPSENKNEPTEAGSCSLLTPSGMDYVRYDIRAPALPLTKTVLSFDARDGRHVEVVWDPLQSNRLDRLIILEGSGSPQWTVSLSAEPQRDPSHGEFDYAWQFSPGDCTRPTNDGTKVPVRRIVPDCLLKGASGACKEVKVEPLSISIKRVPKNPKASEVAKRLVRREGGRPSDAPILSRGRSVIGTDSTQVLNDLASIIAEVAMERAQDRSLKLAQNRLKGFLRCQEGQGSQFTETCKLVSNFRLTDVAGSGEALVRAVSEDLMRRVLEDRGLWEKTNDFTKPQSICPKLRWSALSPVIQSALSPDSRREPDEVLAHKLIGLITQGCVVPQTQAQCDPVQLSLAVLSECEQGLDCNTASIQFYLSHADKLFEGCSAHAVPRKVFDPVSFVSKGLEVMVPKADVSARRQVRLAASMLVDVLKYQAWSHSTGFERFNEVANALDVLQSAQSPSSEVLHAKLLDTVTDLVEEASIDPRLASWLRTSSGQSPSSAALLLKMPPHATEDLKQLIELASKQGGTPPELEKLCKAPAPYLEKACGLAENIRKLPSGVQQSLRDKKWEEAASKAAVDAQKNVVSTLEGEWKNAEAFEEVVGKLTKVMGVIQGDAFSRFAVFVSQAEAEKIAKLQVLVKAISQGKMGEACNEASRLRTTSDVPEELKGFLGEIDAQCESNSEEAKKALQLWGTLRTQFTDGACVVENWNQTFAQILKGSGVAVTKADLTEENFKGLCNSTGVTELDAVARFVDALLSNDFQGALLHLLTAVPRGLDDKQVRVVAALTSFLRTYGQTHSLKPEDAAELREARKRAISTLIDVLASREDRAGAWIASLAVNPGLATAWQFKGKGNNDNTLLLRLNLPVGLSFDIFDQLRKNFGFHGAIFLLDLGQFTETGPDRKQVLSSPRWATALTFGAQVGLLLNSTEDPINISLDLRYSPVAAAGNGMDEDKLGRASVGLTVSYLIPLIDFN